MDILLIHTLLPGCAVKLYKHHHRALCTLMWLFSYWCKQHQQTLITLAECCLLLDPVLKTCWWRSNGCFQVCEALLLPCPVQKIVSLLPWAFPWLSLFSPCLWKTCVWGIGELINLSCPYVWMWVGMVVCIYHLTISVHEPPNKQLLTGRNRDQVLGGCWWPAG